MSVDRLSAQNVHDVLASWFSHHTRDSFPWTVKPENVELQVCFPLYKEDEGFCLCGHPRKDHRERTTACRACHSMCGRYQTTIAHAGRLDLLGNLRDDPRVLCPVDHKTTGQINARFVQQYTMDSQLSGYLWDASQLTGVPAHKMVAFINAIELSVLPGSERKCPTHGVQYAECGPEHMKCQIIGPIERTERQIAEWKSTAVHLALKYRRLLSHGIADIHDVRTEGTYNGSCGQCEFREFCLADRPPKQAKAMFTHEPWDVVEGHDPEWLVVDNSILRAVASCSTQALMRYGLSYTNVEQSGPLHAGTACHLALEKWFRGGTVDDALAAFDEMYEEPQQ